MAYFIGTTIELPVTFTITATGTLTDPTTVTLKITSPAGVLTTYTYPSANVVKDSTGTYRGIFTPTDDGEWDYEWVGTGAVAVVQQGSVYVAQSDIALATPAAVRRFIQKPATDTSQDTIIAELITRASRAIFTYIGHTARPVETATRTFVYTGGRRLSLAPYLLQSATAVTLRTDGTSPSVLASTDYALRPKPPRDGVYRWLRLLTAGNARYGIDYPGERGFDEYEVTVTGTWGWPTVPEDVEHWCIVAVTEWLRLHVQAFSTVLNIEADLLERPEALPSAVRAGLAHRRQVPVP